MKIQFKGDEREVHVSKTKLPPDIKAKWLAALRSGTYKQGIGLLCANDHYCCLGVLSKLQGRLTADAESFYDEDQSKAFPPTMSLCYSNPLHFLMDYCALRHEDKSYNLAALNDSGVPFSTLADIIEYAL